MTNVTTDMTFYDLLDVSTNASTDEIKKAYYRKIRVYTNEEHPEQFMMLRKAYETLSDNARRKEYDHSLFANPASLANLEKIREYIKQDEYDKALRLIKREMADGNQAEELLVNRVICGNYLGNYSDMLTHIEFLTLSTKKDKEFYYFQKAIALRGLGSYREAEMAAKQLLLINDEEAVHHRLYVSVFYAQNKYEQVRQHFSEIVRKNDLQIEYIPLLLDYIMLQEHVHVSETEMKRLRYVLLSMPKDERAREAALYQIIDYIRSQDYILFDLTKEICDIADQMNTMRDRDIQENIQDIRDWIYEKEQPAYEEPVQQYRELPHSHSKPQPAESSYNPPAGRYSKPRGNILMAIIVGILLTGPLTIIGGIIGGYIYYRYAEAIWNFVGCIVVIAVVIAIIGIFFG